MYRLLVLDSSYTLEIIRARKLEDSVLCRDLGGFFEHVWTVHPFASLVTSDQWAERYGLPKTYALAPSHTFVEGKVGLYRLLDWFPALNFILSQAHMLFYLWQLIKREKIDVIRVGSPLYLGILGWILSRCCAIPFVVRVGGNHDKVYEITRSPVEKRLFFHRRIEKFIEQFIFPRADLVAGANQDNLDFALANGARPQYSTLFRYGNLIDKRHFIPPIERKEGRSLLKALGLGSDSFLIYIGRLEKIKNSVDVIKVLAEVRNRGYDLKVVLVGDGQERAGHIKLAYDLRIGSHVIFAGNRDQDWLSRVIPLAVAVLSPHTGRALSEAALAGVPVVAYDVDWQKELVQTGLTGELVPYGDFISMADSLERLLKDHAYAQAMGNAVRKRIVEMMNPDILDQHERDQYHALIKRSKKKVLINSEIKKS